MRAAGFPFALESIRVENLDFDALLERLGIDARSVRIITGTTWSREVAGALAARVRNRPVELLEDIDNALAQHRQLVDADPQPDAGTLVIGVGGGRVLDFAKYHASELGLAYLAFPTVISNDGIASPIAILRGDDATMTSRATTPPLATLIDRTILERAPHDALVNGIGDVISNHSAVLDWDLAVANERADANALARIMSRSAVQNVLGAPPNLRDPVFFERYIDAIVLSGLAMYVSGDSRPCSGAEHLIAHALDRDQPSRFAHGLLVGSIAPYVVWLHDPTDRTLWPVVRTLGLEVDFMRYATVERTFASLIDVARQIRGDRFTVLDSRGADELEREYERFLASFTARSAQRRGVPSVSSALASG